MAINCIKLIIEEKFLKITFPRKFINRLCTFDESNEQCSDNVKGLFDIDASFYITYQLYNFDLSRISIPRNQTLKPCV